jgi:predicted nucleic acid-binding protein
LIVVDASVWISSLVAEERDHLVSQNWLREWTIAGHTVLVPALVLPEVGGAVSRRTMTPMLGEITVNSLVTNPSVTIIDVDLGLAAEAARIAANLPLRGADAVYVALAKQLRVPLITWDREQLSRTAQFIHCQPPPYWPLEVLSNQ